MCYAVKYSKPKQRRFLEKAEHNGLTYTIGCSAYVVVNPQTAEDAWELETCEVCKRTSKKRGRKEVPLLECDQCLRGYHLDCLDPPLSDVPEVNLPSCCKMTIGLCFGKMVSDQNYVLSQNHPSPDYRKHRKKSQSLCPNGHSQEMYLPMLLGSVPLRAFLSKD